MKFTNPFSTVNMNTQQLQRIELQLKKQNSFVQSFMRGLITALGATIGLTIVLGLGLLVLNFVVQQLGLQDTLGPLLQSLKR